MRQLSIFISFAAIMSLSLAQANPAIDAVVSQEEQTWSNLNNLMNRIATTFADVIEEDASHLTRQEVPAPDDITDTPVDDDAEEIVSSATAVITSARTRPIVPSGAIPEGPISVTLRGPTPTFVPRPLPTGVPGNDKRSFHAAHERIGRRGHAKRRFPLSADDELLRRSDHNATVDALEIYNIGSNSTEVEMEKRAERAVNVKTSSNKKSNSKKTSAKKKAVMTATKNKVVSVTPDADNADVANTSIEEKLPVAAIAQETQEPAVDIPAAVKVNTDVADNAPALPTTNVEQAVNVPPVESVKVPVVSFAQPNVTFWQVTGINTPTGWKPRPLPTGVPGNPL